MNDENDREATAKTGRRSTDNKSDEGFFSSSSISIRYKLFGGFFSLGLITSLLTVGVSVGKYSTTLDTAVTSIAENKETIKSILSQNRDLIITLKEQNIQQKESDKRFESMFKDVIDGLDDVKDGVNSNEKDIIILQQKVSRQDKTALKNIAFLQLN